MTALATLYLVEVVIYDLFYSRIPAIWIQSFLKDCTECSDRFVREDDNTPEIATTIDAESNDHYGDRGGQCRDRKERVCCRQDHRRLIKYSKVSHGRGSVANVQRRDDEVSGRGHGECLGGF